METDRRRPRCTGRYSRSLDCKGSRESRFWYVWHVYFIDYLNVEGFLVFGFLANTAQLKERLRRLELYGPERIHPSEDPRRQQADVLVFHMADVETCDASLV
jgi:hypothetical protein